MVETAATLIDVRGLNKHFAALHAVNEVTFSIAAGEIFGLVGPDGAGKTTTLRMLAGVMTCDQGSIVIDGVDVRAQPEKAKRHISYMPQRFGLYEDLTVDENIRFYAELFEMPAKIWQPRAESMLAAANMTAFRKRLAGKLSGGMKQKLGLTCSLVHAPKVLLLDEPTTGVDPVSRRDFWQILYALRAEGVAMLISTAYLDEAERCDRLGMLYCGRLAYCDTPAGLKARLPGVILDIATEAPRAALAALRQQPGVQGLLPVGIGLHAQVDSQERLPQLARALQEAKIPYSGIEQVMPSIEDVFVALLQKEETAK